MNDESENCWFRFRLVDSNSSKQIDPNDTNFRPLKEDIMRLWSSPNSILTTSKGFCHESGADFM